MRVHSIDYLRGAMASSILLYHFVSWSLGGQSSETILGRLGIYGVSTFYVISGMSMFIAYRKCEWGTNETISYLIKRFMRIAPLFAVATTSTIIVLKGINPKYSPTAETLISNLTLAFGFYNPSNYIATGGWSIGNEMVFYYFFPIAAILVRSPAMFLWLIVGVFGIYSYYAFAVIGKAADMGSAWKDYINPVNQGFLFLAGVAIGKLFMDGARLSQRNALIVLFVVAVVFCLYPATGNQISIVSGYPRLLFTALCILCVYSSACISISESSIAHKLMEKLGEISYSMYMLHGAIGLAAIRLLAPKMGITTAEDKFYLLILGALPTTIILSLLVYTYVEMPIMRLAKRIAPSRKSAVAA